jgi:hypothetical protein
MTSTPAAWADQWRDEIGPTVPAPPPKVWSADDVAELAAELYENGWEPAARGGQLWWITPHRLPLPLGMAYFIEPDDGWPFLEAVWDRLVDVHLAMSYGNRQRRRFTEKMWKER